MTSLGNSSDNSNKRCPYIGLRDDADTALGFPSNWNCCHSVKPIDTPNLEHQRNVCLTARYGTCLVFHAEQKRTMPKDLRAPKLGVQRKVVGRWIAVWIILFLTIVSGLLFAGYWTPSWVEKLSVPQWISRAEQVETATNIKILIVETDTPRENTILGTPTVPTRDAVFATQTEPALIDHCAYPLETPFGINGQFLLHRIAVGESMAKLTVDYETTENAIRDVNYFLPSPLWAEVIIVIPLAIIDADGLPSFKPVFIEEDDISLEELAQSFAVSSSDLIEFNQLNPFCRSFYGWILVPAERISP